MKTDEDIQTVRIEGKILFQVMHNSLGAEFKYTVRIMNLHKFIPQETPLSLVQALPTNDFTTMECQDPTSGILAVKAVMAQIVGAAEGSKRDLVFKEMVAVVLHIALNNNAK